MGVTFLECPPTRWGPPAEGTQRLWSPRALALGRCPRTGPAEVAAAAAGAKFGGWGGGQGVTGHPGRG